MSGPLHLEPIGATGLAWLAFERNSDERGWLSEVFNQQAASELGLPILGQDNVSHTEARGLVRGLHFQKPPHAQAKVFRVTRGTVLNVTVDLRPATFGAVHAIEMGHHTHAWIYIPPGFAHGFQSLQDDVEVHYKVSRAFAPDALGGVRFDDPALGLTWPLACPDHRLSMRDRNAAPLDAARGLFED